MKINKKTEIRKIKKVLEEKINKGNSAEILFSADGKLTGHTWGNACGFSKENQVRNGDFLFSELLPEIQDKVVGLFQVACWELNQKQLIKLVIKLLKGDSGLNPIQSVE